MLKHTLKGGTMTTEGRIPYKKHPIGIDMPVKLNISRRGSIKDLDEFQKPFRDHNNQLVYCLPDRLLFEN